MTSLNGGGSEFGSNGRSPAERQKLLAGLRKQLPPAGAVSDRGGSPLERTIALLVEFLLCMLKGKPASAGMLADHPAYAGSGLNFIGHRCKKIGLQWCTLGGKKVYPEIGANMLKLCQELNELAPEQWERVAQRARMSVDEIIDFAWNKFQDESCEPVDEFVDLPEDFQLDDGTDSESVMSRLERMIGPFKAPYVTSAETPIAPRLEDSNSESPEENNEVPDDASIREERGGDFDLEQLEAILRTMDLPKESEAEPSVVPQPDSVNPESSAELPSQPEQVSEQSPE